MRVRQRPIRVLLAKPGLDGHDVGAKVVAQALRDAGMEVVYTGLRQTPEAIAQAALQEAADVVGLSILSGAHLSLCRATAEALEKAGAGEALRVVGGVIPERDRPALEALGFRGIFPGGTPTADIARWLEENVR